ncbi:hypothetical protein NRB_01990 [Novosphingobium sp. 11B]
MSIDTALYEAKRRIAALDYAPENEQIATTDHQLAQIELSLQTARARREEILRLIRELRGDTNYAGRPTIDVNDGMAVADALLAGVAPSDAASRKHDLSGLEHERDALSEGMSELTRRQTSLQNGRQDTRRKAARRTLDELKPLCAAYTERARAAGEEILRCFAALSAIGRATNSNAPGLSVVGEAAAAVRGPGGLVQTGNTMEVPAEILELVEALREKGPAYMGGTPKTVQLHDPHAVAGLVAAMRGTHEPAVQEPRFYKP